MWCDDATATASTSVTISCEPSNPKLPRRFVDLPRRRKKATVAWLQATFTDLHRWMNS